MGYWVMAFLFLIDYLVIEFFNFMNPKEKIELTPHLYGVYKSSDLVEEING